MKITLFATGGFDIRAAVRIENDARKMEERTMVYSLYVFTDGDGNNTFAICVSDGTEMYISVLENYTDARELFALVRDGIADGVTLSDIVEDYYTQKAYETATSCDMTA